MSKAVLRPHNGLPGRGLCYRPYPRWRALSDKPNLPTALRGHHHDIGVELCDEIASKPCARGRLIQAFDSGAYALGNGR